MMSRPSSAVDFSAAKTRAAASALTTPILVHPPAVEGEGPLDGARLRPVLAGPESAHGRGPGRPVPVAALGTELGAEREELGEVGHGLDVPEGGDSHEPVCVQVVPEQDGGVAVRGVEEARAAVVEQVALVDRLDAEREALLAERREDGQGLAPPSREKRPSPERALPGRLLRDRLEEVAQRSCPRRNSAAASTVRSTSRGPWAVDTKSASNCEGAT